MRSGNKTSALAPAAKAKKKGGGGPKLKNTYFTPEESFSWLQKRMSERGVGSLEELSLETGVDKGTLSRYFRQLRRPSIDVLEPLCITLAVSPETILIALGALPRKKN